MGNVAIRRQRIVKPFIKDKQGIFWVTVVGVALMIVVAVIWLVCALVLNKTLDAFASSISNNPQGISISDNIRNQGGIIVVVVEGLLLLWVLTSAFRRERVEY